MWDTGSSVGEISGHGKKILSCDFKQTRPFQIATASEDMQVCCLLSLVWCGVVIELAEKGLGHLKSQFSVDPNLAHTNRCISQCGADCRSTPLTGLPSSSSKPSRSTQSLQTAFATPQMAQSSPQVTPKRTCILRRVGPNFWNMEHVLCVHASARVRNGGGESILSLAKGQSTPHSHRIMSASGYGMMDRGVVELLTPLVKTCGPQSGATRWATPIPKSYQSLNPKLPQSGATCWATS